MKRLLILRHAKSSWKEGGLSDLERPLNKRGERDAPRMGALLGAEAPLPDLILSSPARRCRQTLELLIEASGYAGGVRWLDELYMAGPAAYLHALNGLPDEIAAAMVVGHNPGLEELLALLTGAAEGLPTAALALVELPVRGWKELGEETHGKLKGMWRPKEL